MKAMSWIHRITAGFRGASTGTSTRPGICETYGHSFVLTPLHPSVEETAAIRSRWDTLADEALAKLSVLKGERDLYTTLKEDHQNDDVLNRLWSEANTVPEWVDWEQIERGQNVYYRYAVAMVSGLTYSSLLAGMGANRIVEVLARTGGFSKSVARRRMFETTQHILQCTRSIESIKPGGDGHISSIKVRLLHAAVRGRIMKLRDTHPKYYDLDALGMPINDLDSIATILSFSATLIFISLPRQGLYLTKQEILDYLALWRLVAHYVGCPTNVFATPELARAYLDHIIYHEIRPSPTSKILSQNVIASIANQPPSYPSADFLVASARWVNGNEICDALGLPKAPLFSNVLVFAQCVFACYIGYSSRVFPGFDKRNIAATKEIMFKVIVRKDVLGGLTNFDFQFVPQLTTMTEAGSVNMEKKWREMKGLAERRSAKVLVVVLMVLGVVGLVGMWLLLKVVQFIGPAFLNHVAFGVVGQNGV